MSLRVDGVFTAVVCDTCGAEHPTAETVPVLAFYDATLRHGWVGGSEIKLGGTGVHCPGCVTASKEDAR